MGKNPREIKWKVNENGCHICISHSKCTNGYIHYKYRENGVIIGHTMHRYIYEKSFGRIPDGLVVRHLCNEKACINIEHLAVGTQQDNINDKTKSNRGSVGEKHGASKLSTQEIKEILSIENLTHEQIARKYDMSKSQINKIINRKSWKCIGVNKAIDGNFIPKGEKHVYAKLTELQVREIKFRCNDMSHSEVAKKYGISKSAVGFIRTNKRWKHIKEDCHD